jgi:hypothetical protein
VDATGEAARTRWSSRVDEMIATGELRPRESADDPQVPGRRREHLAQLHQGIPVFGGALTRQWDGRTPTAVYGTLYTNIAVDTAPRLSAAEAASRVQAAFGVPLPGAAPELVVLPGEDGRYRLAYRVRIVGRTDTMVYFVDANTGKGLLKFSDLGRPVM